MNSKAGRRHRGRHPLPVLLTVGILNAGVLGPSPPWYLLVVAAGYALWSASARLGLPLLGRSLRGAAVFVGVIVVLNATTDSGTILFRAAGMAITREGILIGLEHAVRLLLMLWGGMLLMRTVPPEGYVDMAEGLTTRVGRPVVSAWMVAICYLPVVVESARRMVLARKARGEAIRPGISPAFYWMTTGAFPFFATALRNSDALAEAMEARHFNPRGARSRYRRGQVRTRDIVLLGATLVCTVAAFTGAF